MRLPSTDTGLQSPPLIGELPALSENGSGSGIDGADQGLGVKRARTLHSRWNHDYRLRGLELGHEGIEPAPPSHSAKKARPSHRQRQRLAIKLALAIVVAAGASVTLRAFAVQPFTVPSAAMTPTLQIGDQILVVKSNGLGGPIHLGDIVVFRHPNLFPCKAPQGQSRDLVQRVIGLPGDTIWSAGKNIYINGQLLNERGWYDSKYGQVGSTSIRRTKILPDKYFVMGDNRYDSCDSRVFGTIARSSIIGKVFAIVARGGHVHLHFF